LRLLACGFVVAALLLAACGRSTETQQTASGPAPAPADEAPAPADESGAASSDESAPGNAEQQNESESGLLAAQTWTGDLDGMVERRAIRALVPYSKTFYFIDKGSQRGIAYDYMKAYEDDLNSHLKSGNLRVHVVFIPTTRDQMLEKLNSGRGDVAVLDATITEKGLEVADFTTPIATGIKEIVVTGPAAPPIANLDDLAGKTVFVRPQSSREAHLKALSDQLVARGLKPIDIQLAAPEMEPEDMLEMTNAGLLPAVVVNRYYGTFWKQVFDDIVVREDLVISDDNDVGFGMRKGSPQLKASLDTFLNAHRKGTEFGNVTLQKYLKSTVGEERDQRGGAGQIPQLVGFFRSTAPNTAWAG
jgi:membrane-bound lytic murein transglycosylase MltF